MFPERNILVRQYWSVLNLSVPVALLLSHGLGGGS
jgi:hypothetical protein